MEVGQPGTPAPRARGSAPAKPSKLSGWATRSLGASGFAGTHRPLLSGALPSQRCPRACRCHLGLVRGFGLPSSPCSIREMRCCCRLPAILATGRSSARLVRSLILVETGAASRWMPSPGDLDRFGEEAAGLLVASPNNPTGTMISAARLAELADCCRQPRPLADLRRDLSRPRIRDACRHGACPLGRCHRRQQLLQIFQYDGLADRLAGGA